MDHEARGLAGEACAETVSADDPASLFACRQQHSRKSVLFAHGRISQIFPMRNPTKADAMEPSSDSRNNRIWFSSREPDIHEVVNPSDLLSRVNRRPKKTDRY